jgi:hypothetical protein
VQLGVRPELHEPDRNVPGVVTAPVANDVPAVVRVLEEEMAVLVEVEGFPVGPSAPGVHGLQVQDRLDRGFFARP